MFSFFKKLKTLFQPSNCIKYQCIENGAPPVRGYPESAGIDLPVHKITCLGDDVYQLHTNIVLEIPKDHFGLLLFRSGAWSEIMRSEQIVFAQPSIIDSDYRGEILYRVKVLGGGLSVNEIFNQRPLQLIIIPYRRLTLKRERNLTKTRRGEKGFGSSN
jgi:dUTPase